MTTENGKTALITGASSGIGRELAKLFAQDGYNLILVARSGDVLESLADEFRREYNTSQVTVIAKDLAGENAAQEIYDEVAGQGLTVNILVNDAALSTWGKFATDTHWQAEKDIIHINTVALTHLTKLFLRGMVERNEGRILNVASLVSVTPMPLMTVYAATKAYVLSFSQSLINELKDTNVTVTALMPNATATDFFNKAGASDARVTDMLDDAAVVARDGYKALMRGEHKVVPGGIGNKATEMLSYVMPQETLAAGMRKLMEPKNGKDTSHNDPPKSQLAWGIGLAALALAGIAVATLYANASESDKAQYRYRANRLRRNAQQALADAQDGAGDQWDTVKQVVTNKLNEVVNKALA